MKTLGFSTLKGSSDELLRWTKSNEVVVMTDNGKPVSLSIPFDDALLHEGLHIQLAAKLFEECADLNRKLRCHTVTFR